MWAFSPPCDPPAESLNSFGLDQLRAVPHCDLGSVDPVWITVYRFMLQRPIGLRLVANEVAAEAPPNSKTTANDQRSPATTLDSHRPLDLAKQSKPTRVVHRRSGPRRTDEFPRVDMTDQRSKHVEAEHSK